MTKVQSSRLLNQRNNHRTTTETPNITFYTNTVRVREVPVTGQHGEQRFRVRGYLTGEITTGRPQKHQISPSTQTQLEKFPSQDSTVSKGSEFEVT